MTDDRNQKAEATLALLGFTWDEELQQYVTGPNKVYAIGNAAANVSRLEGEVWTGVTNGPTAYFYKCMHEAGCEERASYFITVRGAHSIPLCTEHGEQRYLADH